MYIHGRKLCSAKLRVFSKGKIHNPKEQTYLECCFFASEIGARMEKNECCVSLQRFAILNPGKYLRIRSTTLSLRKANIFLPSLAHTQKRTSSV
jgi:hypothetical protein